MAAPQIGEETKVTLDLKTIGMIVGFMTSRVVGPLVRGII